MVDSREIKEAFSMYSQKLGSRTIENNGFAFVSQMGFALLN